MLILGVNQAGKVARDRDHHADDVLGDVVRMDAAVVRERDSPRLERIERRMVDAGADPLHPAQIRRGIDFVGRERPGDDRVGIAERRRVVERIRRLLDFEWPGNSALSESRTPGGRSKRMSSRRNGRVRYPPI